jgi:hypothetical protein
VRDRSAEQRNDRIANELFHGAAEALKLGPRPLVVRSQACAHVLRVEALGDRRRADDVAEENRDDLPFLARGSRFVNEQRGAGVAETSAIRVLLPTTRTNQHARIV